MPIRKVNGFKIERVPGTQPTLKKAQAQLRAIKARQGRRHFKKK